MNENPLETIMNPGSVVIAGASNNFHKMGTMLALSFLKQGFAGQVAFLHPSEAKVLGKPAYRDSAELPFIPDLAVIVTPAPVALELLNDLGAHGVRHALIITAGFREIGDEGARLEAELLTITKRHGMRFVGPNCIGILNAHVDLNLTVIPYRDRPGGLAMASQSGSYLAQTQPYLRERGIRFSQAVSVGNAADIDIVDCLEYLGGDPKTQAIALYIEGIERGRDFVETAARVAKEKPIVALYAGGTDAGARSGFSHTGSMGGPDALYRGIFEQAGVIRASTMEELFGWGHALASMPIPKGDRMAVLTHSGGPATSMADTCERTGLQVPVFSDALQEKIREWTEPNASEKNPVDLTFSVDHASFIEEIPALIFRSDEVDGVLMHGVLDTGFGTEMFTNISDMVDVSKDEFVASMRLDLDRLLALPGETGKPLVASNFLREDHAAEVFRDNDIPLFRFPEDAVKAMAALVRYGEIRARLRRRHDSSMSHEGSEGKTGFPEGVLDEFESKALLARYGVPVAGERRVSGMEEALAAAETIGYPVVLKGLPEGVAHKSEAGLVRVGIHGEADLVSAWEAIEEVAPACVRLVAEMLSGDRELVVGMMRFPGFGPCVMLGVGGIFTETIRDMTFRMAPVDMEDALAMPDSLHLAGLFDAQRGLPAVDRQSLALTIQGVGRLALEHPEIAEIDVNPLIVVRGVPVAADALIVLST